MALRCITNMDLSLDSAMRQPSDTPSTPSCYIIDHFLLPRSQLLLVLHIRPLPLHYSITIASAQMQ